MQVISNRRETSDAIRSDLGAIFVSMELSRSIWLITSLSPGGDEKMSKHTLPAGDIGALLTRFSELGQKASMRTERSFPIIVIQEAGLDGFWIHRVLESEGIESHVVDPASIATSRRRRRAKTDRIDGEACFARFWRISAASLVCARWSSRPHPRKRTADACAVSAEC
jgi:transposase